MKWRDQINSNREKYVGVSGKAKENCVKQETVDGLGTEILSLMKKATADKKTAKGKRKPFGDVSKGAKILQSKGAAKRELEQIQRRVADHDMC